MTNATPRIVSPDLAALLVPDTQIAGFWMCNVHTVKAKPIKVAHGGLDSLVNYLLKVPWAASALVGLGLVLESSQELNDFVDRMLGMLLFQRPRSSFGQG